MENALQGSQLGMILMESASINKVLKKPRNGMKMKLPILCELHASIFVSILLSLEAFVQQETAVQCPCCSMLQLMLF